MCAPSPALLGIARDVIAELPSVPTNVGDPVNAMLLSSRYATFSPWPPVPTPEKPVMVPLALAVTGVKADGYPLSGWLPPGHDAAALRYQDDPSALSAYVQIVNSYCALGRFDEARTANERAKVLLKKMPPDSFADGSFAMPKDYWQEWLKWTGDAGIWK